MPNFKLAYCNSIYFSSELGRGLHGCERGCRQSEWEETSESSEPDKQHQDGQ